MNLSLANLDFLQHLSVSAWTPICDIKDDLLAVRSDLHILDIEVLSKGKTLITSPHLQDSRVSKSIENHHRGAHKISQSIPANCSCCSSFAVPRNPSVNI